MRSLLGLGMRDIKKQLSHYFWRIQQKLPTTSVLNLSKISHRRGNPSGLGLLFDGIFVIIDCNSSIVTGSSQSLQFSLEILGTNGDSLSKNIRQD